MEEFDGNGAVQRLMEIPAQGGTGGRAQSRAQSFAAAARIDGNEIVEIARALFGNKPDQGAMREFAVSSKRLAEETGSAIAPWSRAINAGALRLASHWFDSAGT